jgi:hypothetical protein
MASSGEWGSKGRYFLGGGFPIVFHTSNRGLILRKARARPIHLRFVKSCDELGAYAFLALFPLRWQAQRND